MVSPMILGYALLGPGKWRSRPFDPPAFATDFKSTSTLLTRT
jgi:hypothetical protein